VQLISLSPRSLLQNEEQLSKFENEILLTPGDDTSSYAASQPPSVAGPEWSAENSMDDFPEGSMKEEDSILDAEDLDTTGEDYPELRAQLSTPVSAADQCKILEFIARQCNTMQYSVLQYNAMQCSRRQEE